MNRINLICLGVRDMEKSLQFYRSIGFTTYEKANCPPIVFFDTEGSKLELYPIDQLAKDIDPDLPVQSNQRGFNGITLACNMKSKEEVDSTMARVQQHGGNIVKPAQDVFWGGYSGYFQDPDGYYWEVAYGKQWKFDANNMLVIEDTN